MMLCCVAVLSACGATSHSASGSQTRTVTAGGSPRALASAAAACSRFYAAAYALAPPVGRRGLLTFVRKQTELRSSELTALNALAPPPTDKLDYRRLVLDLSALNTAEVSALNPARAAAMKVITAATKVQARLPADAGRAQLPRCGENPYSANHSFRSSG